MRTRKEKLSEWFCGRWYPPLCALLILLGHSTGWELAFGGVLFASMILGLWVCNDLRFAILPFCAAFFLVNVAHTPSVPTYSTYYTELPSLIWFGCVIVGLVTSLVAFMIRNRHRAKHLPDRRLFWSMVLLSVALLTNGLFSANYTVSNLLFVLGMIGLLLGIYVMFSTFVRFDETAFDYFMYCLVLVGLLISAQLLVAYATTVQFVNGSVVKETVVVGWGVWTSVGCMLSMLMPACFYFAYNHKRGWIGYLLGLFEFACILLTQSRAALLVGGVLLLACLLMLCVKGKNRALNRWMTGGLLLLGTFGAALLFDRIWGILKNYIDYGFADNGRFEIWRTGVSKFLGAPIFGSGFYDSYADEEWTFVLYPHLYHNTLLQMLASCGVVGVIAYAWHRFCTLRLALSRPNAGKSFLSLGMLGLLLFSLLDVIFFNTYPMIIYALMLLFMQRSVHE